MPTVNEINVRERAYEIWQECGCPDGQAMEHWLRAESELNSAPKPKSRGGKSTKPRKASTQKARRT